MWSWISKVSQGKLNANFPYEMGEKVDIEEQSSPWVLYEGKKQVRCICS